VDKDGNWIKSWGELGSGPGQFLQPHSIATDSHGNVYVADRGNRRIQVFDDDGKYLREIHIDVPYDHSIHPWMGNMPYSSTTHTEQTAPVNAVQHAPVNKTMQNGAPWAICITPGPDPVLFASDGYPGRVYKLKLDGTVLGVFGQSGRQPGQFGWIHEIACPSENKIYVAELLNWRLQMIVLAPSQMSPSKSKQ
jgi:DNA-binding beta-propeller fold protein YncE